MGPLRFVDRYGNEGWITDDLAIVHSGSAAITASIETSVDEVESNSGPDDDVLNGLIIELYDEGIVRTIERIEGDHSRNRGG